MCILSKSQAQAFLNAVNAAREIGGRVDITFSTPDDG